MSLGAPGCVGAPAPQRDGRQATSPNQVDVLERFGTLPLNRRTRKLLAFHRPAGAKRVEGGARHR